MNIATIKADSLLLDSDNREVLASGQPLRLTPRQYEVLSLLIQHYGQLVPKDRFAKALSGFARRKPFDQAPLSHNNLEVVIHRLRKCLAGTGASILTERRAGYRLLPTNAA